MKMLSCVNPGNVESLEMLKVVLCLLVFYFLISIIPILLYYPFSLVSLFVPSVVFLYAICTLRCGSQSGRWLCCFVAIAGILIKVAATIVYLMVFPSENLLQDYSTVPLSTKSQSRADLTMKRHRVIFFMVLIAIEILVLLIGVGLKWHLSGFERIDNNKRGNRTTTTSDYPLVSEELKGRTRTA
ncbi:hypothetical protein RB195_012739 [Necator americanus]|uniref:Endoplasmic reticulum transmembrane protein n=1 Tax=Necator americanus TaxID=51031 RepID=A0ABR1DSB5_NECAM